MAALTSGFTEAQYQSYIESLFIDDFRPDFQFDIYYYSGSEERDRGYDLEVRSFIPIFLQIKRSDFYFQRQSNNEMNIRHNEFHYKDVPGAYFFKLHLDDLTIDYLQHNLLFNLCDNKNYARYLAPLFINKDYLLKLKYSQTPISWNNIINSSLSYNINLQYQWRDYFNLYHSILIKPHNLLNYTAGKRHKYFFNRVKEISFHSEPIKIEQPGEYLKEFIDRINKDISNSKKNSKTNIRKIFRSILKALRSTISEDRCRLN
jgi:hypothetical protein